MSRALAAVALAVFTSCSLHSTEVTREDLTDLNHNVRAQNALSDAVKDNEQLERIKSGAVHCPASAQPEWEHADARAKARMLHDCRRVAELADGGMP